MNKLLIAFVVAVCCLALGGLVSAQNKPTGFKALPAHVLDFVEGIAIGIEMDGRL